jgi:hypothetical protein
MAQLRATLVAAWLVGIALLPQVILCQAMPPPTGQYNVGKKKLEIDYVNTDDPIAPNNVTTAFLATIYYPTLQPLNPEPEPYLDPATAAIYEVSLNMTTGSLANLTSTLLIDAPPLISSSPYPTLIFGPGGGGPPVEVYTGLLTDLASYGYTVIGLDHPYEQPFIRWPNGTGLVGLDPAFDGYIDLVELVDVRINETMALIDRIALVEEGLGAPIDCVRIGAFGHSVGGAAAVGAQLKDQRILSGINIDGTFFGTAANNDSSADTKTPVFLFGSNNHNGLNGSDSTWATFPAQQTGWWRMLNVDTALHVDFADFTIWKAIAGLSRPSLGPIDGIRMTNITRTFVRDFFDMSLLGETETIFNAPSPAWPEVVYTSGENGTV